MFGFDKTFFKFLWGFVGILAASLALILIASAYIQGEKPLPVDGAEQTAH